MKVLSERHALKSKLLKCLALVFCLMVTGASSSSPSSSSLGVAATRESISGAKTGTEPASDSPKTTSDVIVRFYLIRHGETQANLKGLVLGQTDSVRDT